MEKIAVFVDDAEHAERVLGPLLAGQAGSIHWVVVGCAPKLTHRIGKWTSNASRTQWRERWARALRTRLEPLFSDADSTACEWLLARGPLEPMARELRRPLLTLDLSAVMSSFLGRTGANVRHVLDYAKSVTGVLLLDELDAIAKRRDDTTDVGELKRLVTVLLQEIDDWPPTGLLIAATNHADLLDPAVWRRFEMQVEFPLPTEASVHKAIETFLGTSKAPEVWNNVLAVTLRGLSYSDIERELMLARRASVTRSIPLEDALSRSEEHTSELQSH